MPEWRSSTWGEEVTLEYGRALRDYSEVGGAVRVFGTNGPIGWTDTPLAQGPGVILGRKGAYRGVHYSPDPFFVIDTAYYVVPKTELDMRWLYYAIIHHQLGQIDDGSPIPSTTRAAVYPREIDVPLPDEQRAIARVLGALDDKIEQNRRTARALERLARAIFQAWFVDFEPVKAKAEGTTAFPSMSQPVFDALPTRFVESAIGPVPEGWEVKPLAEIATFLNGLALQKYPPRADGEDLRVIKIAELRKGSAENADLANSDVPAEYVIDDGDLLFSWSGTLEAEFWFGGKGALNQHLFKVTSSQFPSWFCLRWIREHLPWFRTIAASKATTMGHIKRGHLEEAQVVVPPAAVTREADKTLGRLHDLNAQLMIESRRLAATRDYLLPKLLSGDVRVARSRGEGVDRE
ncbi:restriction endonuclease subunit S [Gemmatimonas sp.]|uniref:restriction endonuclease subunit S n=1 Tax=Gemmatimonas sp. TaxID=1962908 RepID=UPI0033413D40